MKEFLLMYFNALVRSFTPMITALRCAEEEATDWADYFSPLSIAKTEVDMMRLLAEVNLCPGEMHDATDWDVAADAATLISIAFGCANVNEALRSVLQRDFDGGENVYEESAQWLMVDCLFNIRFLMIAVARESRNADYHSSRRALNQLSAVLTEVPIAIEPANLQRLAAETVRYLQSRAEDPTFVNQFHDFSHLGIPMNLAFDDFDPLDDDDAEEDEGFVEFDLLGDTPWGRSQRRIDAVGGVRERELSELGAIDIECVNPVQSVILDAQRLTAILCAACDGQLSGAA